MENRVLGFLVIGLNSRVVSAEELISLAKDKGLPP